MYEFEKPRGTEENVVRARKIESHLRIPTLPVGIKIFKNEDGIPEGVGTSAVPFASLYHIQDLKGARSERTISSNERQLPVRLLPASLVLKIGPVTLLPGNIWEEFILIPQKLLGGLKRVCRDLSRLLCKPF
jgi:hypothetical protein